ncbi:MAG: alpha/beta hydrolase [Gammaproteobacteria bacterium]|nr:alpha/beta hydrolase [Gammaproteobacteria bacterium]
MATDIFARDTFRIDPFVCPFKGDIEYEPGEIECGLLQVPENRENPDSRFIELHFVKLNSTWDDEEEDEEEEDEDEWTKPGPGKRDDPVIYLSGGPGSHAAYYVKRFKEHGILNHRDMYILEQRGVGYSDDFCPNYGGRKPGKFDVESYDEQQQAALEASDDCRINALAGGVDVSGYNTIENARDVHALRRSLGIDQWNVWGISYGTILGQAYIREDSEGIRAIVLDSIVPINAQDEAHYWQVVQWYDRDLQKLDELCQAQPSCAKRYPDLGKRLRQATSTVIDNPITVGVKDTELFPSGEASIFQDLAAFLPFVMLYEQTNYPGLPAMIYAWTDIIESRDEDFFKALAGAAGDDDGFGGGSQGMYDAIFCLDGYREAQIQASAADREAFPILGNVLGSEEIDKKIAQRCRELGMPPRDSAEYVPVSTDIPSLIVAGDMDPITPPPLAKAILPGFSNATYVEFPFAGHGPLRSVDCGGDLLNLFYDSPHSEPDLSCVDQMQAPEFHTPLYRTAIAPRMLLLAVEDEKKLIAPGAWGGVSVLVSLIAFIFLTVAPIGRFIDKRQPVAVAGARWFAWLAATLATAAVAVIGAAAAVTFDESELLAAFGLVPWARYGAVAGLLAGLFGIAAIVQTVRTRMTKPLPIGTLLGFLITGLASLGLSSFLLYWDLGPF